MTTVPTYSTVLTRRRLDRNEVALDISWGDENIGTIRRKRVKGVWVYILLDSRDWYVNCYDNIRAPFKRACDWGFRGRQG
jgi:hypothetical protein